MDQLNVALAAVGLLVLLLGFLSEGIRRTPLAEPLLAVAFGVLVGPIGLRWLDIAEWGDPHTIMEEAARLTLAIGLMAVALRLRRDQLALWWKPMALLLAIGMPVMFAISAAFAEAMLAIPLLAALLVAGAVTPTDPIVASSIVTGKFAESHLPRRVRTTLSLEAGANDALAYLFMLAPVLLLTAASTQEAVDRWLIETLLLGVVGGALLGAAIGYGAALAAAWAERKEVVGSYSFSVLTVALSLTALGLGRLLNMDELLVVFAAGLAFNLGSGRAEEDEEAHVQESVNRLFTLPAFVLFGLVLPWEEWASTGWALLAAFAVLALLLRRLPLIPLMMKIAGRGYKLRDWAFIGWFGPNGVAAIFYALYAVRHTGHQEVWAISSFVVCASMLIHGMSAAPLTRAYARAARRDGEDPAVQSG